MAKKKFDMNNLDKIDAMFYRLPQPEKNENRFVAYVKWRREKGQDQDYEEIDVNARHSKEARKYVREILKRNYMKGGRIYKLILIEKIPGVHVWY